MCVLEFSRCVLIMSVVSMEGDIEKMGRLCRLSKDIVIGKMEIGCENVLFNCLYFIFCLISFVNLPNSILMIIMRSLTFFNFIEGWRISLNLFLAKGAKCLMIISDSIEHFFYSINSNPLHLS